MARDRWRGGSAQSRQLSSPALFGYLLDLDQDLADDLDVRMRLAARPHVVARLLDAEVGECDLSSWFSAVGDGPGLLVLSGLVAVETHVADRATCELVGCGDLLQPPGPHADEIVEYTTIWRALTPTRLALLDTEFIVRVRSWPALAAALFRRAERRSNDLEIMRAIACQPRLELRLALALWHMASRWGRVEPAGLRLELPLTHRLLGQLVAAERPSITHALRRLADAGIVTGAAGDWHLHGSLDAHLEALSERLPRLGCSADARAGARAGAAAGAEAHPAGATV